MLKESLWCSVLRWLLFLELKLPFFLLDLLHIPALFDPGNRHSIPDHSQAETVENGIAQCLLNWSPRKRKEIKLQATGIQASSHMYPKLDLSGLNGREVSFHVGGQVQRLSISAGLSPSDFQELR